MKPSDHDNNNLKIISELWSRLLPWQRKSLVIRAFFLAIPGRMQQLHPADVVIPAMACQVIVFVVAVLHSSQILPIFAIGNILIVALAMTPSLFASPASHDISRN